MSTFKRYQPKNVKHMVYWKVKLWENPILLVNAICQKLIKFQPSSYNLSVHRAGQDLNLLFRCNPVDKNRLIKIPKRSNWIQNSHLKRKRWSPFLKFHSQFWKQMEHKTIFTSNFSEELKNKRGPVDLLKKLWTGEFHIRIETYRQENFTTL